ncbi:MAG TPA: heavy metal-binding domain-containing protein [Gaiellaceae bacterium]|jgi:uncharacterized protein YbjQ (UPF0145 family)
MRSRGGGAADPAAATRAEASRRALEAGGLPIAAQERLAAVGRGAVGAYTSDLTTNEFLLLRGAGFRPLAQLMGSCVYQTGFQYSVGTRRPMAYIRGEGQSTPGSAHSAGYEYDSLGRRVYRKAAFGQVFELDLLSEAWRDARGRALSRLSQEAKLAGADAVVGVHLRRGSHGTGWSGSLIEFIAVGTGIRSERYDLGDEPVLSNLSGQEFAALYRAGYWPVGLVVGTTVTYVMTGTQQKWERRRFGPNRELKDYTQGVQYAQRVALSRLDNQARALEASGIVGLRLDVEREEHEHEGSFSRRQRDLVVTAHALGTAVVRLDREAEAPPIELALFLNEERR